MGILFFLVLGLVPACQYAGASGFLGAFISGLTFASDHEMHHSFGEHFNLVLQVSSLFIISKIIVYVLKNSPLYFSSHECTSLFILSGL